MNFCKRGILLQVWVIPSIICDCHEFAGDCESSWEATFSDSVSPPLKLSHPLLSASQTSPSTQLAEVCQQPGSGVETPNLASRHCWWDIIPRSLTPGCGYWAHMAAYMWADHGVGFQKFCRKVCIRTYIHAKELGHWGRHVKWTWSFTLPTVVPLNSWGLSVVGKVATVTLISWWQTLGRRHSWAYCIIFLLGQTEIAVDTAWHFLPWSNQQMIRAVSRCCHTALGFSQQYMNKYCVFLPCFCLWFSALLGTIPFNNHIEVCHLDSPLPAPLHYWRASCGTGRGRWHQKPWGRVGGGAQSSSWVSPRTSLATKGLAAAELVWTSVEDVALKKQWLNVELFRHNIPLPCSGWLLHQNIAICPCSEDCRTSLIPMAITKA